MDNPPPVSDYLKYLPPFLGSPETDPRGFLGRFLCTFEALLTGRSDAGAGAPLSVEAEIDRLPLLFDPWRTPVRFLPFLAARLGLTLEDNWGEYQRRLLVENIVGIYQKRWLKRGLYTFLDLYAATGPRPRIAIDDGEALLAGTWVSDSGRDFLDLHPIAFARPKTAPDSKDAALLHPTALTVGVTQREYVVADAGSLRSTDGIRASLWRLSPAGQFLDWSQDPHAVPVPLNAGEPNDPTHQVFPLTDPCAVVADADGSYLVLDRVDPSSFDKAVVYRYKLGQPRQTVLDAAHLKVNYPVDMIWEAPKSLLVLDMGKPAADNTPQPRLVRIRTDGGAAPTPPTISLAPEVIAPGALIVEPAGTVLVADGRGQDTPDPAGLVRVTLGAVPQKRPLLANLPPEQNPLLSPKALALGPNGTVLACDLGTKSGEAEPIVRAAAESAGVYRLDLTATPPRISRLKLSSPLVNPVRMAWDGNRLLLLDYGFFHTTNTNTREEWRTEAFQFGMVVDFSATRPSSEVERLQVLQTLANLLERERPAHVTWRFQFELNLGGATPAPPSPVALGMPSLPPDLGNETGSPS
jgi:phage tail-like protein